jgi:Tol biopolymer transport system component
VYGDRPLSPLYARDELTVTSHAQVWFKVQVGKQALFCETSRYHGNGVVRVAPRNGVLIDFRKGKSLCSTSATGGRKTMNAGPLTTITSTDPIVEILADTKNTIIRLRRGVAVVKGRHRGRAIVLGLSGRGKPQLAQQVVVPRGKDPLRPTTIKLTAADKTDFAHLASALPQIKDTTAPLTNLLGFPASKTTIAAARFTFEANEPGVVFSCALDSIDFRACSSPVTYPALSPGDHTFRVRATDPAGNTGPAASHPWTIVKNGSRMIAFASNRTGNLDIYLINPDGSGLTRLTNSPALDADPAWSPDRTKLAFHSERDDNSEIYVMNADGSDVTRLTDNPAIDRNPAWSPDGKRIVFESYRDDGNREIYAMNADGSGQTRLTFNEALDFDPDWSPDGNLIAFASERDGNREIYVMHADGTGVTRLTDTAAAEYNPEWSPDGHLAFHSDRDGNSEIYAMNADGSGQTRLTVNKAQDFNPTWSPDGKQIAFQSDRDANTEIYIMNADGSNQTRVTDSQAEDLVPDW